MVNQKQSTARSVQFRQRAGIGQTGIPGVTISKTGQIVRRGGGGGRVSSAFSQEELDRLAKEAAERRAAEEKARQLELAKIEKARKDTALREQRRIQKLRERLQRQKTQEKIRELRNKEGQRIRQQTLINNRTKERIFTSTNLSTGETVTKTFERPRAGARVRQTGGLVESGKQRAETKKVPKGFEAAIKPAPKRAGVIRRITAKVKSLTPEIKSFAIAARDLTSLGLTKEARDLRKFNSEVEEFNIKANNLNERIDKGLITTEQANKESERLDKELKNLEVKEKNLFKAIPIKLDEKIESQKQELRKQGKPIKLSKIDSKRVTFIQSTFKTVKRVKKERKAIGVAGTQTLVKAGIATLLLPETIINVVRNPKSLTKIPSALKEEGQELVQIAKISPGEFIGRIGGEIIFLKGTGKALKAVGKVKTKVADKILNANPRLLKIKKGLVTIKKSGKTTTLKVGGVKTFQEPLSKQLEREGTKALAVSAQADKLIGILKRKRVIRKPIPGEENLSKITKDLLKKFDKGKINRNEFIKLQKRIRKETITPAQPRGVDLLERSAFFDPEGGLRASRLAIEDELIQEASFLDLIRGRATLFKRKQKPQIIVLDEFVEKLPKTKQFKSIRNKLKKNKPLTDDELTRLSTFQVTPSGKLKPIGSTTFAGGIEREVTLAPTEAIKRVRKLGTLKVGNKRIPIVAVKVVKGKSKIDLISRISNVNKGIDRLLKLKRTLNKKLRKTTKVSSKKSIESKIKKVSDEINKRQVKSNKLIKRAKKADLEDFLKTKKITRRRISKRKRVFPLRRKLTTVGVRSIRGRKRVKKLRRVKRKRTTRLERSVRKKPLRKIDKRVPRKPTTVRRPTKPVRKRTPPRRPRRFDRRRPPIKKPEKIIPRGKRKPIKKKKKPKKQKGYNTFARPVKKRKGQKRPKLVKVNKVPLTKNRAKDLRNYVVDTSLSRTGKIKPTRLKPKKPKLKAPRGYAKRSKQKFRSYRIVKGKRVPLKNAVVERRGKSLIDTRQEKKGITLRRRIRQLTPSRKRRTKFKQKAKKRTVKKITRKQMLKNLARARRMKKLKRRSK